MKLRRCVALLVSAAMLHLSVKPGEACATPSMNGHHAAATTSVSPTAHASHSMNAAAQTVANASATVDTPPCDVPVQQQCCDALAGCGASTGLTSTDQRVHADAPPASRASDGRDDAPPSFALAPEPPPPKA